MALFFEKTLSAEELSRLRKDIRECSQIEPWRQLGYIAIDWAVIAGIIYLMHRFANPWTYLVGVFLIASRQHALAVMSHEGAHYRMVHNKRGNTVLANVLCAYPLFFQVEVYRHSHLLHHQYTNQPQDPDLNIQRGLPDWDFPMTKKKLMGLFIKDLLGKGMLANFDRLKRFNADPEFKKAIAPEVAKSKWIRIAFYACLATGLTLAGAWKAFAIYWMVPLLWILPSLLRLRNMSEHYGLTCENDLQGTRDIMCGWIEGWLLAPHYIRIHLVHHLYPSVPFYKLPQMKKILATYPTYKSGGHENSTYVLPKEDAVWRDLISIKSAS